MGVDGRWRGGVDGRWRRGRSHPRSPHACQTGSGMRSNPPHPKVHDPSHKSHRIEELSSYLFFYYDGLNWMNPGLVIL